MAYTVDFWCAPYGEAGYEAILFDDGQHILFEGPVCANRMEALGRLETLIAQETGRMRDAVTKARMEEERKGVLCP